MHVYVGDTKVDQIGAADLAAMEAALLRAAAAAPPPPGSGAVLSAPAAAGGGAVAAARDELRCARADLEAGRLEAKQLRAELEVC